MCSVFFLFLSFLQYNNILHFLIFTTLVHLSALFRMTLTLIQYFVSIIIHLLSFFFLLKGTINNSIYCFTNSFCYIFFFLPPPPQSTCSAILLITKSKFLTYIFLFFVISPPEHLLIFGCYHNVLFYVIYFHIISGKNSYVSTHPWVKWGIVKLWRQVAG